ncbi:type III PLP-dependent enzyme [Kiloniella sp.]|uniref:type III PLP-dependent enzyme n=1 Tax=Kiloniella sp. TaxID=1938587 RepID=UPI003B0129C5
MATDFMPALVEPTQGETVTIPMANNQLSPKVSSFFTEANFQDPHLVVDLEQVSLNYQNLNKAMPQAEIFYAVKANPEQQILQELADLGSSFDAASLSEIESCLALGISADRISFGNTIKKQRDIAAAFNKGIRFFAFDSAEELRKLAESAPGSHVFCRVLVNCAGAEWPLSNKFGCSLEMAEQLMIEAQQLGLIPTGFSFHVGSQQTQIHQWGLALNQIKMLYSSLKLRGIPLTHINLGGGFPTQYTTDIPSIEAYGQGLELALEQQFGEQVPKILIEPGRYIVGNAGIIEAEVILVAQKQAQDERRWVYLDIGIFSGLAECMDEAIKYPISIVGKESNTEVGSVILAGPSCDSVDVLYKDVAYQLPLDLKAGDKIRIHSTGAYTSTYSSVGFNGFPPLKCVCI